MNSIYVECHLCGTSSYPDHPMGDGRKMVAWIIASDAKIGNILKIDAQEWFLNSTGTAATQLSLSKDGVVIPDAEVVWHAK